MTTDQRRSTNLLLLLCSTLLSLVMLEVGLRLLTPFPVTVESNRRDDPRLGYVMDTDYPEVDSRGFRNPPGAYETADLVFIGDSHTFGYNVDRAHSFPSIVAERTGRAVYNFGIGSYGIYQYAVLLEDTLGMKVRDVLLAVYLANDLYPGCRAIRTAYWQTRARETDLRLPDCGNDPTIAARETLSQILKETAILQAMNHALEGDLFVSRSAYFLFADGIRVERARAAGHSEATSLANADVRLNFANARRLLVDAADRLAAHSIHFVILLIPSKERVVHEWLLRRQEVMDETFERVVVNERTLTDAFTSFLSRNGIDHLDSLPYLVDGLAAAIADGEQFYRANDGHPLERGYAVYAQAAIEALHRPGNPVQPPAR